MDIYYRVRPFIYTALTAASLILLLSWPYLAALATAKPAFWISLVAQTFITGILVLSLNLAMGYSGLFSMMHAGLLAFGGYTVAILSLKAGANAWLALAAAVVLTTVFAGIVIAVSLRATYIYFGMITFAFNMVVVEVAREWEGLTGGYYGVVGLSRPSILGGTLTDNQFYYVCFIALVAGFLVYRNVIKSRSGRSWQAVRESTDASSSLGIRTGWARTSSWLITGGLGGLAGGLFAFQLRFINPDVAVLDNVLILLVGLLLGGMGTVIGPILGVALLMVIDQLIKDYAEYRRIMLGVILLAAMIIIPAGIVGAWKKTRFGRDQLESAPKVPVAATDDFDLQVAPASADTPAVSAKGITKNFGGLRALDNVSLDVMPGEIHGLIGPNGSGKSTLVNCITSFFVPDAGTVEFFGSPAPRRPHQVAALGVSRVFQVPHLFERLSLVDNVLTGTHMHSRQTWFTAALRLGSFRRDEKKMRVEAIKLLRLAGLAEKADWPAGSLSHGQKRLLEVARALATRPRVLILDEPATGLTPEEISDMETVLRRLAGSGLTIALIEHNMSFVMRICDRITVLDGGILVECGTPEVCRDSEAVRIAYLGGDDLLRELTGVPALAGATA